MSTRARAGALLAAASRALAAPSAALAERGDEFPVARAAIRVLDHDGELVVVAARPKAPA